MSGPTVHLMLLVQVVAAGLVAIGRATASAATAGPAGTSWTGIAGYADRMQKQSD
jgi:hypothetical protein